MLSSRVRFILASIYAVVGLWNAILAVPYFLLPYYSANGPSQGIVGSPVVLSLPPQSFLIVSRASTNVLDTSSSSMGVLFTATVNTSACFPPFQLMMISGVLQCSYVAEQSLSFLSFSPPSDEFESDYVGPRERAQSSLLFTLDISAFGAVSSEIDVAINMQILDFGFRDISQPLCNASLPCNRFLADLYPRISDFFIQNQTLCMSSLLLSESSNQGCSALVSLSSSQDCSSAIPQTFAGKLCAFHMHFSVFPNLSILRQIVPIWSWLLVVFIGCQFLWLLAVFLLVRSAHIDYLGNYYVRHPNFYVLKNTKYKYKIFLTGRQYSNESGRICLRDVSGNILYSKPFSLEFFDEDIEGFGYQTAILRGFFLLPHDALGCNISVEWNKSLVYADFEAPSVVLVLRQDLPFGVRTRANVFFMPLFALFRLLFCLFDDKFRETRSYLTVALFSACANMTWIVALTFNMLLISETSVNSSVEYSILVIVLLEKVKRKPRLFTFLLHLPSVITFWFDGSSEKKNKGRIMGYSISVYLCLFELWIRANVSHQIWGGPYWYPPTPAVLLAFFLFSQLTVIFMSFFSLAENKFISPHEKVLQDSEFALLFPSEAMANALVCERWGSDRKTTSTDDSILRNMYTPMRSTNSLPRETIESDES